MFPTLSKIEAPSVLVVDDEALIVDLVDTVVRSRGFACTRCTAGQDALDLLKINEYDLLICDYHMPGAGGRELMEWIEGSGMQTKVLVLSGDHFSPETLALVDRLHAQFLPKPFGIAGLATAIDGVMSV